MLILQQALANKALHDTIALSELLHEGDGAIILKTARAAYSRPQRSLLDELAGALLPITPIEIRHQHPFLVLCAILETPAAQAVAIDLLTALDWYGQHEGETPSHLVTCKLMLKALALDLDPTADAWGFDFEQAGLRGQSMRAVRTAISDHVRDSVGLSSQPSRPLVSYLLTAHLPAEFQVLDVPEYLAWRRSNTWVHFNQGVRLAEMMTPGKARTMTFEALCAYASTLLEKPSPEAEALKTLCATTLAVPLLQWGVSNRLLPDQALELFSEDDVVSMFDNFAAEEETYARAVDHLSRTPPDRLAMARAELNHRGIPLHTMFVRRPQLPISDQFWVKGPNQLTRRIPAEDIFAANQARSQPPAHIPEYLLGRDLIFHPQVLALEDLPDIEGDFEALFAGWIANSKTACQDMISALLRDLPEDIRKPLSNGILTFHMVRQFEFSDWEMLANLAGLAYREIIDRLAPVRGHYGFLIEAEHNDQRFYYEVLPYAGLVRLRHEWKDLPTYQSSDSVARNARFTFNLDAQAYLAGQPPKDVTSERVILETVLGPVAADGDGFETRVGTIAREMAAKLFSSTHVEQLRKTRRGTTYFDTSYAAAVGKVFIPVWGPLEDLQEGLRTGDRHLIKWSIIGLPLDALSLVMPAVRLAGLTLRSARMAARMGIQSYLPTLRELGKQYLKAAIAIFNPVEVLKAVKGITVALTRNLRQLLMRAIRWARKQFAGSLKSVKALQWTRRQATPVLLGDQRLRRVDDGRWMILHQSTAPRSRGKLFVVEPASSRACGRALRRLNNHAGLSPREPLSIPLEYVGEAKGWLIRDITPNLSKRWVAWGEEHYFQAGNTLYRKFDLPSGGAELRRVHADTLEHTAQRLRPAGCRQRRGLDLTVCSPGVWRNLDHSDQIANGELQGVDIVPWFNDRAIEPSGDGEFVHNHQVQHVMADGTLEQVRTVARSDYREQIEATVLGGNDRFKQLHLPNGVVEGVDDSRRVSAVVAHHRTKNVQVLVTRIDDQAYYKGIFDPGSTHITLTRIRDNVPSDTSKLETLSENDALHYIYNGSADAHHYFNSVHPQEALPNLKRVAATLTPADKTWLQNYIGGPFDLGTEPEEAALFCRFSQHHLLVHSRGPSSGWNTITHQTPAPLRAEIATQLDVLHGGSARFTSENLLLPATTNTMAEGGKNLAFMRVRFRDAAKAQIVFYSLSGLRNADLDVALTRMARDGELPAGWVREGDTCVAPDSTRYINSQFTRMRNAANPGAEYLLFLPDLSNTRSLESLPTQQRMLDSERMILQAFNKNVTRLSEVDDILVFSQKPTCQSCTLGLGSLRKKMPEGHFTVVEGAKRPDTH
jgi:hypothetical protein